IPSSCNSVRRSIPAPASRRTIRRGEAPTETPNPSEISLNCFTRSPSPSRLALKAPIQDDHLPNQCHDPLDFGRSSDTMEAQHLNSRIQKPLIEFGAQGLDPDSNKQIPPPTNTENPPKNNY